MESEQDKILEALQIAIQMEIDGKVYNVSQSFHWKGGIHQVMHHAGLDLTEALKQAPHGPDMLERVPIIGELLDS